MKRFVALLDYVFLLRPTLWYPVWIFFIAGYWGSLRHGNQAEINGVLPLVIAACLTLMMGAVYIFNQLRDIETDRINHKLFLLADGMVSEKHAMIEAVSLALISLCAAFLIDRALGVLFVLVFLITGVLYNYPPASWKDRPIMGMAANGMGCVLIYAIGWTSVQPELSLPGLAWLYGIAGLSVSLNTTLPDIQGDRASGKRTFAVAYGIEATAAAAAFLEAATIIIAWMFKEYLLLIPAAVVLPFYIWAALNRTAERVMLATKVSVIGLALAVCWVFPWILLPVLLVFFASRFYYKKRFNMNYPAFKNG